MKIILYTLLVSSIVIAQPREIQVTFIGNCGLHLTDGETDIYVDFPYKSGAYGYMTYEDSVLEDVIPSSTFIFTHQHNDHYSGKDLRKVIKAKGGQRFTQWNIRSLKKWAKTIPDFEIEAFRTKHSFSIRHRSYLIAWHGKKIFLSGDTEHAETIGKIKDIDLAFVPYWLLMDAKDKEITIDAKKFAIYHIAPNQIPSAKEKWSNNGKIHPLVKQGEKLFLKI
jgi:L-ascorbate metabolism protein UlaG (beta-lactamase superfamily)